MKLPLKLTCHCGAVELAIHEAFDPSQAYRCNCSFCARRGAVAAPVSASAVEIVQGAEALETYQWNTNTARHHFCRNCGIYTHHHRRLDPGKCGLNLGAIEDFDVTSLKNVGWLDGRNHPSDAQD